MTDTLRERVAAAFCEPGHRDLYGNGWPLVGVTTYCGRCLDIATDALAEMATEREARTITAVRRLAIRAVVSDTHTDLCARVSVTDLHLRITDAVLNALGFTVTDTTATLTRIGLAPHAHTVTGTEQGQRP